MSVSGGVDGLIVVLPKVELHVHLEGSMQPALLLELARKHDLPSLPPSGPLRRVGLVDVGMRVFPQYVGGHADRIVRQTRG